MPHSSTCLGLLAAGLSVASLSYQTRAQHIQKEPIGIHASSSDQKKAETSNNANGFRGTWFDLEQKSEFGSKYSGGLDTYTANHVPMAHRCFKDNGFLHT